MKQCNYSALGEGGASGDSRTEVKACKWSDYHLYIGLLGTAALIYRGPDNFIEHFKHGLKERRLCEIALIDEFGVESIEIVQDEFEPHVRVNIQKNTTVKDLRQRAIERNARDLSAERSRCTQAARKGGSGMLLELVEVLPEDLFLRAFDFCDLLDIEKQGGRYSTLSRVNIDEEFCLLSARETVVYGYWNAMTNRALLITPEPVLTIDYEKGSLHSCKG